LGIWDENLEIHERTMARNMAMISCHKFKTERCRKDNNERISEKATEQERIWV